jgi:hypothetical protein
VTTRTLGGQSIAEHVASVDARDANVQQLQGRVSDATGTFDYPDIGYGAMSADEISQQGQRATGNKEVPGSEQ